jgi:hypothetical protein
MKRILIVIVAISVIYGQSEEVVAVIDIANHGSLSEQSIKRVCECIRSQVTMNKRFIVLESEIAVAMLKEQGVRMGLDCSSDECLLKIGKQLYAKKVIGGSLQRAGDVITIDLKMLDVQKNSVISTSSMMAKTSIDELLQVYIPKVIKKLCASGDKIVSGEEKKYKNASIAKIAIPSEPTTVEASVPKEQQTNLTGSKSNGSTNLLTAIGGGLILSAAALIAASQSKSGKSAPASSEIPLDAPTHNRGH